MPNVALSTFVKLLHRNTNGKISDLARYSSPGGYDYYRTLRRQSAAYIVDGVDFDQACKPMLKLKIEHEEANNLEGMKKLKKWWQKNGGSAFAPPKGSFSTPQKKIRVKLEPEFGFERDGVRKVVAVWNTKSPKLTKANAGIGIYLMQKRLKKKNFADCEFTLLDLRTGKVFDSSSVPNQAEAMLRAEMATIDSILESLETV